MNWEHFEYIFFSSCCHLATKAILLGSDTKAEKVVHWDAWEAQGKTKDYEIQDCQV